jgi:hypothetical protein
MNDITPALLTEPLEVALGDDSYCESCGSSWNQVTFDPDWDETGTGHWTLSMLVGCCGGDSASARDNDWAERVESILARCAEFPGWTATVEQAIRGHLAALAGKGSGE